MQGIENAEHLCLNPLTVKLLGLTEKHPNANNTCLSFVGPGKLFAWAFLLFLYSVNMFLYRMLLSGKTQDVG